MNQDDIKSKVMQQAQGALSLNIAYIGIANNLFETIDTLKKARYEEIADKSNMDASYVLRWCEAAYSFDFLEIDAEDFFLTEFGKYWLNDSPDNLMPFAVQSILSAHFAESSTNYMKSGEQPGEKVIFERPSILPLFGPLLEKTFSGLFLNEILKTVPVYKEVNDRNGIVVDLGCGNGWYLRKMLSVFPKLKGIGLDGFDINIENAIKLSDSEGLTERLHFQSGDLHHFTIEEPVDLIAMNRSLHHVWDEKENVFRILKEHLKDDGYVIIWEPNWPLERKLLKEPSKRGMAFQNLAEHVQGNHFLNHREIELELKKVGMTSEAFLFAENNEAVIIGKK